MKTNNKVQQQDLLAGAEDVELRLAEMTGLSEPNITSANNGIQISTKKRLEKRFKDTPQQGKTVIDKDKSIKKSTGTQKKMPNVSKPSDIVINDEIIKEALEKHYRSEELKPYQAELIKLQHHLEMTGKKMVILFDGRDASGKGGTIRRIIR
jgi:hypothetical protein